MNTTAKPNHIGRKISKIRELRGMKQEALAQAIGVSQQTVSHIENSEEVEEKMLLKIAEALEVSVEAVKNFSEDAVLNIIGNTYNIDNASSAFNFNCPFNPMEKVVELYEDKEKLYERLLQAERDKVAYLEELRK